MTKFEDYTVEGVGLVRRVRTRGYASRAEDTVDSVLRALARAEPWDSIREGHDRNRKP